jgi:hypothetical protein
LRIAIGVILGVDLDVLLATLESASFRSPWAVQQAHAREFPQR